MYSYYQLALYILAAECLRRLILILKLAYTGPLSKIPGPWTAKLTGIPWAIKNITGTSMNDISGLFEKYGEVVRIGPNDVLFGGKAAVARILLEEDLKKAPIYESVQIYKGVSNLFTETDKPAYKAKRRLLSPGFSISYLNGLEPQMQDCVKVFVEHLDIECTKVDGYATIDFSRVLSNLTFDVMSATSFGGSFGLVTSDDQKVKNAIVDRLKHAAVDGQLPFLKYLPFIRSSMNEDFNNMITDIIAKRRAEMSAKAPVKRDLLQLFIETNDSDPESFTDLHMREEMSLFMIAGSDTSSATLTATLLLLVNNMEKLEALLSELQKAFPNVDEEITFAKTQDLPFLNAVLSESMRLMPIIRVGLPRWTTETTIIAGYELPPETLVSACVQEPMLSPKIWPDASQFVPERWLGSYKGVDVDRKAYYPFSAGSRNCIGQQFALKEMRVILATLVRRYELKLVKGQSHEMRVHTVPWFLQGFYNADIKRREV